MMYNPVKGVHAMKRTNIYLEAEETRLLKHIAVEEGCSFTVLVRRALQDFLTHYQQKTKRAASPEEWNERLEKLLVRVRQRTSVFSPEEIEADITAAAKESRRRQSHVAHPR
jgi:hypothetical protein